MQRMLKKSFNRAPDLGPEGNTSQFEGALRVVYLLFTASGWSCG